MQKTLKVAALALLVSADAVSVQSSTSLARAWLRSHAAPSGDELAELKGVNPDAYAIVKALLTKRSLGLLDPRHPTASFANTPAPSQSDADAPKGSDAFQLSDQDKQQLDKKGGGEGDAANLVAAPYADVAAAPVHHGDWLNWKPQDSAMNDEAMVNSVLGTVANLKQEKPAALVTSGRTGSALEADEAAFGGKLGVDVAVASEEEKEAKTQKAAPVAEAPVAAASTEGNTYLNSVDFGLKTAEPKPKAAVLQGNSYLRGLDLSGDGSKAAADDASTYSASSSSKDVNYLASFSWGDDKPAAEKKVQPAPQAPAPKKKQAGLSSLSSWLNLGGAVHAPAAPAAKPAAQAAPATAGNPYLQDW